MSGPRIGSLFSGYGGLDMGVQAVLGGELAWVADIDPGACAILAHHHPDVPNLGDVSAIQWLPRCGGEDYSGCGRLMPIASDRRGWVCDYCQFYRSVEFGRVYFPHIPDPVDVLTGGTPCQDLSHAGRRAGMTQGTRSNLWVAMREAIAQLRPGLVIWENVRGAYSAAADSELVARPGLLDSFRRRDDREPVLRALGRVLGDLSDLGYDAVWHGLRAADVGAPHSRFRVFVTAWPAADSHRVGREWARDTRGWRAGSADGGSPVDLTLLPTPMANEGEKAGQGVRTDGGQLYLTHAVHALLPTPRASDGEKGGPNQRGSSGDLMLPSAVALLPTPSVADVEGGRKARSGDRSDELLLNGIAAANRWGEYAAAIHHWENLLRPAPEPTQPSSKGKPQLAPAFVEWMMGLPAGHVTDPGIYADLTDRRGKPLSASAIRNLQLRALGNGVVLQQSAAALRWGLAHAHLEVSA